MSNKFIYVFSSHDKEQMILRGFNLIKSDAERNIYVFENKEAMQFSISEVRYVLSDMLTF